MNPVLYVVGIVLAALLIIAAVVMFILGKKTVYGASATCLAVVIVASLLLFGVNGKDEQESASGDENTPVASGVLLSGTDVSDATGNATSMPTDTSVVTATPEATEAPTAIVTEAPTDAPTATPAPKPTYAPPASANGSTVYLTFDDGPSVGVTETILDTLKKYDVKATFFIIDFDDEHIPILKRMVNEGHTIGIHGYSHVYSDIYANEDAFMNNIYKLSDKLVEKIGYKAEIIRFPGGASNMVSKQYCPGIMTALTKRVVAEGFQYFDWNVSPEDAMSILSAETISNSVLNDLRTTRKQNVVLMHDSGSQKTTAQAIEAIIEGALAKGYAFDRLTKDTPAVQHSVQN